MFQVLDLSGNPLTTLGPNQFRKLGLSHLQRVILQRCSLRHVDPTAFAGLTNLVELDLSHNALGTVPGQAFVYAPELRELKLNGNPLVRINGSPFTGAAKLVRLEMANCQIIQLDVKAFTVTESRLLIVPFGKSALYSLMPATSLNMIKFRISRELKHQSFFFIPNVH